MHRELAERSSNGIVVQLLWDDDEDRVIVRYEDAWTGESFAADIPRDEALTAFEHPNAYRPEPALI